MKQQHILVLGAGRSSSALISYLLSEGRDRGWTLTVGDGDEELARRRIGQAPNGCSMHIRMSDEQALRTAITNADLVISLLPAAMHPAIAAHCLAVGKHLLTASYVSPDMRALDKEVRAKGLLFLNECGLDPGLDHMSAMSIIHRLQRGGYTVYSFESFTGGLIDPVTDPDNPWKYRFTWNPRNVVVAGQGTATYRANGLNKYIPYHQLFQRTVPIEIPGVGRFEGYANRNSLQYKELYGLPDIDTMMRGTLRFQGFCAAWNVLVQLGCTDDTYEIQPVNGLTHAGFLEQFVVAGPASLEQRVAHTVGVSPAGPEMEKLRWAGFFQQDPIGIKQGTPAQITERILSKCWTLQSAHRDLVVMWHRFAARRGNERLEVVSSFSATGDVHETAMAKTVGLPLALAAKLLLTGALPLRGVVVPVQPCIYEPLLQELQAYGILFSEHEQVIS